jgi:polygalacturonase
VVVPSSGKNETVYFVDGTLWLEDNVELHLEANRRLLFGFSPEKYPVIPTRWGDYLIHNYAALIQAKGKTNVAITGKGVIDGNGGLHAWHQWYGVCASKDESVYNMMAMCDARVPLELRRFGHGAGPGYEMLRPPLVQFFECERVLVEGVRLERSPLYNIDLEFCENVTIRNVTIRPVAWGEIYNDDGVDVVSSNYGLVEDCDIRVMDDAIVAKAGLNKDAWGRKPSSNMVFRNNLLQTAGGAGAVALGSGVSGGIFNVFAERNICAFGSPVYLKSSMIRGGEVSHAYFRDMSAARAFYAMWIQSDFYIGYGNTVGSYPSRFAKIFIDRLTVGHTLALTFNIKGCPDEKISGLYVNDVVVRSTEHLEEEAETEAFHASGVWIPSATGENAPLRLWRGNAGEVPRSVLNR